MAMFVNTLRCRRCAIALPRRCIDARGRTYVEDLWPPTADAAHAARLASPPFETRTRDVPFSFYIALVSQIIY